MIIYFTGTGNSKYVADFLGDKLQDEVVSLNDIMKNNLPLTVESEKPFVWVAPIYAWQFPLAVDELFRKMDFQGNSTVYFVATMGGDSGNCYKTCQKHTKDKGMLYGGFAEVKMPDNYFEAFNIKNPRKMVDMVKGTHPLLEKIAETVKNGHTLDIRKKDPTAFLKSSVVNYGFNKYFIPNTKFSVNDSCSGCGKCAKICPVNNIKITDGRPVFDSRCMSCYGCINKCPEKAINLGKKTEGKTRYVCIEYKKESL